jgi:hypothetical protein
MKAVSCFYIVGSVFTVASISLYFAYLKKQEEVAEQKAKKAKESFRGGGGSSGAALHYGGGGTGGGSDTNYASVSPLETFCSSDDDCGGYRRCGTTGFCV